MTEHDVERELTAALQDVDRGSAPAVLRDRVLAIPDVQLVGATPAQRAQRSRTITLLVAAALVGVLAGGAIVVGSIRDARPSPPPLEAANPTVRPTSDPTDLPSASPGRVPRAFLLAEQAGAPVDGSLPPGRYALPNPYLGEPVLGDPCGVLPCADYRRILLTLPEGWAFTDGLHKHLGRPDELSVTAWTTEGIYPDPCHWEDSTPQRIEHHHPPDGSIVFDTVALLDQLDEGADPVQMVLGDQATVLFRMSVPVDLDIASCDQARFRRWAAAGLPGSDTSAIAGQRDDVYAVDVDRNTLLVKVSRGPAASAADVAELDAIISSIAIDR